MAAFRPLRHGMPYPLCRGPHEMQGMREGHHDRCSLGGERQRFHAAFRGQRNRTGEGDAGQGSRMVPALKEQGLWEYEPAKEDLGSDLALREKMYYFRHYRQYWKEMGWIEEEKMPQADGFGYRRDRDGLHRAGRVIMF